VDRCHAYFYCQCQFVLTNSPVRSLPVSPEPGRNSVSSPHYVVGSTAPVPEVTHELQEANMKDSISECGFMLTVPVMCETKLYTRSWLAQS